jgi:hypothetical protein
MASRHIDKRVADSFPPNEQDKAKEYLDWILSALSDTVSNLRRSVTLMITLMAAYEFVIASPKSSITLAGFEVNRASLAFSVIPVLVAFLLLQTGIDNRNIYEAIGALNTAFARWSPSASANGLIIHLRPAYPLYWRQVWYFEDLRKQPRYITVELIIATALGLVLTLAALAFEVQAFWVLFPIGASMTHFAIWLLSLCITAMLLAMYIAYRYVSDYSGDKE